MMKKLLVFWRWIVGATIVFGTILFVSYQQHCATEKYKRHRQEYCAAFMALEDQKIACEEEGTSARDYLPWGYELLIWPEGITTWAIILTGLAIFWQSNETRKSADAAKQSAAAARISADIAVGVSIPTLVVCEFGKGNAGAADKRAFLQSPKIKISIKNYGQTTAFLKWWTLCFSCEDLPETPVYDGPADGMILDKIVVEPTDTFILPELFWPRRQMLSNEDVEAIIERRKTLRAYGYICYGDIFGNPLRRLKFCETALNIFDGDQICDWWEGWAPPAYTGTEQYPSKKKTQQESRNPN
jgi:hypothetical protein